MRIKLRQAPGAGATILLFPQHRHGWAASKQALGDGLRKASIGTSPPDSSESRLARPRDASLRPAKMLRRCDSEQPTAPATAETVVPARSAQASIGCESDMTQIISSRNGESQRKIFPSETTWPANGLVPYGMGKARKAAPREIFLGEWLAQFELGPTKAARIAGCSQGYISNIAAGLRTNVNALYLLRLSEHMKITINDLFRKPPPIAHVESIESLSPEARTAILSRHRRKG